MKNCSIYQRPLFRLFPLFCVASIVSGGCSSQPTPSGPAVVTKEEANQIKVGMTLDESQKIIGDPGESVKIQGDAPISSHMRMNPDGSLLTVTLRDGKVQQVQPANLK